MSQAEARPPGPLPHETSSPPPHGPPWPAGPNSLFIHVVNYSCQRSMASEWQNWDHNPHLDAQSTTLGKACPP